MDPILPHIGGVHENGAGSRERLKKGERQEIQRRKSEEKTEFGFGVRKRTQESGEGEAA
jgi:hypothetical protein